MGAATAISENRIFPEPYSLRLPGHTEALGCANLPQLIGNLRTFFSQFLIDSGAVDAGTVLSAQELRTHISGLNASLKPIFDQLEKTHLILANKHLRAFLSLHSANFIRNPEATVKYISGSNPEIQGLLLPLSTGSQALMKNVTSLLLGEFRYMTAGTRLRYAADRYPKSTSFSAAQSAPKSVADTIHGESMPSLCLSVLKAYYSGTLMKSLE
jgi:hypothetical protein